MKPLGRKVIAAVAGVVVIASVSWFGLKQHRNRIAATQRCAAFAACKERAAALDGRLESIKQDAHKQLKIGTKKDDISRFFTEHGMSFGILYSEAFGSLYTVGCAPDVHCGDQVILQVRVKLDPAGAVAEEPSVGAGYDSCP